MRYAYTGIQPFLPSSRFCALCVCKKLRFAAGSWISLEVWPTGPLLIRIATRRRRNFPGGIDLAG